MRKAALTVSTTTMVVLIVTVAVLAYLVLALLRPEKF